MKAFKSNQETLQDAAAIQSSTLEALERMQLNLMEAEQLGLETNEELVKQREQTRRIEQDADRLESGLQKSNQLFNRLGRLGLRFRTERAARKEVKKVYDDPQEQAKSKRAAKELGESHHSQAESEKRDATKKFTLRSNILRSKTNSKPSASSRSSSPRGLLDGINLDDHPEHKEELRDLASTDAEIDRHLDLIDNQLDNLIGLSKSVHEEVQTQTRALDRLHEKTDQIDNEQKVVNHRTRRFLDGRLRKQYDIQDTILSAGRKVL